MNEIRFAAVGTRWDWQWIMSRCVEGDGNCVIWNLSLNRNGYPHAQIEGKPGTLIRPYVYRRLLNKALPSGSVVSSKCGDRRCVSPKCLVARTRSEVLAISFATGKRKQNNITANLRNKGYVRLNLDIARQIRASDEPTAVLAARWEICEGAVRDIRRGKCWPEAKHGASVFTWAYAHKEAA